MPHEKPITIKEFAEHFSICEKQAWYMARSESFRKHNISIDIALNEIKPKRKHGTGRRNHMWRIYLSRYEAARDKGLLVP